MGHNQLTDIKQLIIPDRRQITDPIQLRTGSDIAVAGFFEVPGRLQGWSEAVGRSALAMFDCADLREGLREVRKAWAHDEGQYGLMPMWMGTIKEIDLGSGLTVMRYKSVHDDSDSGPVQVGIQPDELPELGRPEEHHHHFDDIGLAPVRPDRNDYYGIDAGRWIPTVTLQMS